MISNKLIVIIIPVFYLSDSNKGGGVLRMTGMYGLDHLYLERLGNLNFRTLGEIKWEKVNP